MENLRINIDWNYITIRDIKTLDTISGSIMIGWLAGAFHTILEYISSVYEYKDLQLSIYNYLIKLKLLTSVVDNTSNII